MLSSSRGRGGAVLSIMVTLVASAVPALGADERWESFYPAKGVAPVHLRVVSSDLAGAVLDVTVPGMWVTDREQHGQMYQQLRLDSEGRTADIGLPEMPYVGRWVAVPHGARITASVTLLDSVDVTGFRVWPAQMPMPDGEEAQPAFVRDEAFYAGGGLHPQNALLLSGKKVVRGCEAALVGLFPLRFDAAEGRIRVYRRARIEVRFSGGAGYFVEERLRSRFFEPLYAGMLVNYRSSGGYEPLRAPRDEEGEMIILVPDGMETIVQPLAEWRTISGLPTVVTTLSDVGGDTTGILQYVQQAYDTWQTPPSFVLLVGDADLMPTMYRYVHPDPPSPGERTGTDLWYFTVDGDDWFADIHHGRISIENFTELNTIVQKLLDYELDPLPGAWNNHVFLASYEEPFRFFTVTSESIYYYLTSIGYDCDRAYDMGYPPGTTQDIVNNWNEGCVIINHRDHSDRIGWNHPRFHADESLYQLNNGEMLPLVYSINCLSGYFDEETDDEWGWPDDCFAEYLCRYHPGGTIGVIAASRTSFSGYNDEFNKGLFAAMFPGFRPDYPDSGSGNPWTKPTFRQGVVLDFGQWYMYDKYVLTGGAGYPGNWPWLPDTAFTRAQMEMYHYFGDPAQDIHTGEPTAMVVSHDTTASAGQDSFVVWADEEGALVALSVDGELVGREYILGGVAVVPLEAPLTCPATLHAVVTAHNRIPYEANVYVGPDAGWYVVIDSTAASDYAGNVDGIIEQGDSVGITVWLQNVGQQSAPAVAGSLSTADSLVTVVDSYQGFGDIPPTSEVASPDQYRLAVAGGAPDGHDVPLELTISSGDSIWVRSFTMRVFAPLMRYVGVQVDDSSGNNNGRPDPGETVNLWITLTNLGSGTATSVQGSLQCPAQYVSMPTSSSPYPDFSPSDSAANTTAYQVSFDSLAPHGVWVPLTLDLSAFGPYQAQLGFSLPVGHRSLLFVDADTEPHEARFVEALDSTGYSYDNWDIPSQGVVPLDTLALYRTIAWTGGDENSTAMSPTNRLNMGQYLSAGGSLLFSAENYLSTCGNDPFTADYLHVAGYDINVSVGGVAGVAGDPISDGMVMATDFPPGLGNYPDEIFPDPQATAILTIEFSPNITALRYPAVGASAYRVVFMATPLEALEPGSPDPNNPETFLKNCLEWLSGAPDTTAPWPINDLAVVLGPAPTELTLSWSAPWDEAGIDHYYVYRDTLAYFGPSLASQVATVTGVGWTDPAGSGDPVRNYYYVVTAVDPSGNESLPSNRVGEIDCPAAGGTPGVSAPSDVGRYRARR
jgi:hypothetical protein